MKRVTYLVVALLALGLLAACAANDPVSDPAAAGATMNQEEPVVSEAETMTGDTMVVEEAEAATGDQEMTSEADSMADHDMADEDMADEDMADEGMVDEDMGHEDMADAGMETEETTVDLMALPAWQQISLTNARTGEAFTLADFLGKTVFVESMATWCTNCRQQLNYVREARAQASEDAVFVALSLETNISDATLAQYADDQGFDWLFAVMTPDMLQEMTGAFGRSLTVAPSTPHFIISPDGSHTDLLTGIDSPTQILERMQVASG